MDRHFDTGVSPPYEDVLAWMLERTDGQDVLDMSAHFQMLSDMAAAKRGRVHADYFDQILFVYLYNSDPEKRKRFLEQPNARGALRQPQNIECSLKFHQQMFDVCSDLADVTINTAHMEVDELVGLIEGLRLTIPKGL